MAGQIKKITVNGETYEIGGGISAPISTTYSELKSLKESSGLAIGQKYRITDFVSSFGQSGITSANHPFDLIIEANANNAFSETAIAIQHVGDDYFSNSNLSAWQVSYCFDNDTKRFPQASSSGKGFIYYLKDEYGNEACYDFKNALFQLSNSDYDFITGTVNAYTFSTYVSSMSDMLDASLNANSVTTQNCIIKSFIKTVLLVKTPSVLKQNISGNILNPSGDGIVIYSSASLGAVITNNEVSGSFYIRSSSGLIKNTIKGGSRKFKLSIINSSLNNNDIIYYAASIEGGITIDSSVLYSRIRIKSDTKLTLTSCTIEYADMLIMGADSEHTISSIDFSYKNVKINEDGTYKTVDPFA